MGGSKEAYKKRQKTMLKKYGNVPWNILRDRSNDRRDDILPIASGIVDEKSFPSANSKFRYLISAMAGGNVPEKWLFPMSRIPNIASLLI